MAEIVDFASFRGARKPTRRFEKVSCMLCDAQIEGHEHDGEVRYVCTGGVSDPHNRLEWTHAPEHVALGN